MFSKSKRSRSIASELIILCTISFALLLTCALGAFYWMVVRHAFAEDNAVLLDKITVLQADLQRNGPSVIADRFRHTDASGPATYWIRVVDSSGRTVAETPGMARLLRPDRFPISSTTSSRSPATADLHLGEQMFSLASVTSQIDGQDYQLQLAQDRTADEQFTRDFGILLALVLLVGIGASAAVSSIVTRRTLQPLADMKSSLERVGPTHLHEHVGSGSWPTELQPLAAAFDRMLSRLEESFSRLSQFSADLAHELRTPLANMLGEAQVALSRGRTPDEYRAVVESTVVECERLSGIVDNLLFVARADAASQQIQKTRFEAREEIDKLSAYYQSIAEERDITLRSNGQGEVFADRVLLSRAVSNLLDNALRFTPSGGLIEVTVRNWDSETCIEVADNGSGIPAEHLPRVFDRFYRADAARSPHGAGLGLALVKSIADLHGGTATIHSEPSKGTVVTIRIPRRV